ncbi:DUF4129 domain-containing protein [Nocardia brasiliensis]|uniref:DUF4129 domain-containing protein n=1 Tax=Nocardia brasiliensis TaxID=37326 RepID=UPI001885883B|nr:DUF4129 domain-containing protein [Nocardia brasiliensis]
MAGARSPILRVIVLITLLASAAFTLRGYLPGVAESRDQPGPPSALSVALMPVLLTVSMVILVAGVIASQHRLPLAMPEPERERTRRRGGLGRVGLLVLAGLAVLALVLTAASAIFFAGFGGEESASPGPAQAPNPGQAPDEFPTSAPDPGVAPTGTALLLTVIAAIALVVVALTGLGVVAVASRRGPAPAPPPLVAVPPTAVDSLARAAEMGLAAMNVPGQDPRTAIIACYVAMERGLAFDRAAAPLVSDTPMEVLARAFERGALHDASARELVALFEEARFSPHAMLEWQRMRAEQLLRIVLADLQGEQA